MLEYVGHVLPMIPKTRRDNLSHGQHVLVEKTETGAILGLAPDLLLSGPSIDDGASFNLPF